MADRSPGRRSPARARVALLATLGTLLVAVASVSAATPTTRRVSVGPDGAEADGGSQRPSLSRTARYVAFSSDATDLVANDTNGTTDVFVRDRRQGSTTRVSRRSNGQQGNDASFDPSISADGRHVAFVSRATNLVPGDSNGKLDVFVHDRSTGRTTRVSIRSNGAQGDGHSFAPTITRDGRYVAFVSEASTLVPGDTNDAEDIFVHDRATGRTTRVSIRSNGRQANDGSASGAISANGRYVAFESSASNLVRGDTNGVTDIFVHDRSTRRTTRASVGSGGQQADASSGGNEPSISGSGRYVAFLSFAGNLVKKDTNGVGDIFVHDRETRWTRRVSITSDGQQAGDLSEEPVISADGRSVAFRSVAVDLVAGDTNGQPDVFLRDRRLRTTRRVSLRSNGAQATGLSEQPAISGDGRFVAFLSGADDLVPGDANEVVDVFLRGPLRS